jgi:hypothetical protein
VGLIPILILIKHLYLGGADARMDTRKTCVYERLDYVCKIYHHSRFNILNHFFIEGFMWPSYGSLSVDLIIHNNLRLASFLGGE